MNAFALGPGFLENVNNNDIALPFAVGPGSS